MFLSAELRWFWRGHLLPRELDAWFKSGPFPLGGGARLRADLYLLDEEEPTLGVKERGGKPGLEVKGLVTELPPVAPFLNAKPQLWGKWSTKTATLQGVPTVRLQKLRWMRKFDTTGDAPREVRLNSEEKTLPPERLPAEGCNFELTQVFLDSGEAWWSFCLESFAENLERAVSSLGEVAKLAAPAAAFVESGEFLSYPAWIARHAVA